MALLVGATRVCLSTVPVVRLHKGPTPDLVAQISGIKHTLHRGCAERVRLEPRCGDWARTALSGLSQGVLALRPASRRDPRAIYCAHETFRRIWSFYLAYSEAGSRSGYLNVVRLVLARKG